METVYAYLVSEQFRDRVQRIVSTWEALKNQVDTEERAMQRQWKGRRKQLNVMIDVTTDMYTDISAIIGAEATSSSGPSGCHLPPIIQVISPEPAIHRLQG